MSVNVDQRRPDLAAPQIYAASGQRHRRAFDRGLDARQHSIFDQQVSGDHAPQTRRRRRRCASPGIEQTGTRRVGEPIARRFTATRYQRNRCGIGVQSGQRERGQRRAADRRSRRPGCSAVFAPFSAVAIAALPTAPSGWRSCAIQPNECVPAGERYLNSFHRCDSRRDGEFFAALSMRTRSPGTRASARPSMSPAWMPCFDSTALAGHGFWQSEPTPMRRHRGHLSAHAKPALPGVAIDRGVAAVPSSPARACATPRDEPPRRSRPARAADSKSADSGQCASRQDVLVDLADRLDRHHQHAARSARCRPPGMRACLRRWRRRSSPEGVAVLPGRRDRQNGNGLFQGRDLLEILRGQFGPEKCVCPGTARLRCCIARQAPCQSSRPTCGGGRSSRGIALRNSSTTMLGNVSSAPAGANHSLSVIGWLFKFVQLQVAEFAGLDLLRDVDRIEEGDRLSAARNLLHELDRIGFDGRLQRTLAWRESQIDYGTNGHGGIGNG